MTTTDKLKELISRCKAGVNIEVNEHRNYYETAKVYIEQLDERGPIHEVNPAIMRKMIETDTIINIHFYPRTPVGFYSVYHYDLDAALDEALACLNNPNEVTV